MKYFNVNFKAVLVSVLFMLLPLVSFGQSRAHIREAIQRWGECRNVAITKTNGDLALYRSNGYAATGLPSSLSNALDELNEEGEYIDDVQLTESGKWVILWGDNGCRWNDIPYSLERKLREYNNNNETITSITFNDGGDWIVITTDHYSASETWILNWLKDGNDTHGMLWAACITSDAMVAVYADGYKFFGNVPEDLKQALRESRLDVYRIKMAGTAWFFADKEGNYRYSM